VTGTSKNIPLPKCQFYKKQFAAKKYKILFITHDMESFKFSSKAKIDHSYICVLKQQNFK